MISIINTFLNYRIQKVQSFERTQRERSEEEERKVHLWRMEQKSSFPNTELERSNGLKILCLDGGGCGISSLYNLQAIMTQVAPGARPCDHFDLICGTSTGGLIAIMLGRLRMSIEHCIEEYKIIARDVFGDSTLEKSFRLTRRKCLYSGNKLTKAIKRLVEKYGGDADARLKSKDESCRTFVLATRYHNTTTKIFRAYDNLNSSSGAPADSCTIWEAGRATCCTPFLCPEISIPDRTGISYCNGSPHINNPAHWNWATGVGISPL
ncbi:hypothetical protein FRC03_011686 [Tulasnella sp. 419]|nr:hypothetical protein FRC03_011686 [Tulasnella sp. 419]